MSSYVIDSEEADWNSGLHESSNLGNKIQRQGGYHAIPPLDATYNLRSEMVGRIEEAGIPVRYHHHEVGGPGQSEIEIALDELPRIADITMLTKNCANGSSNELKRDVLAVNLRHSCAIQPDTRVLKGAHDKFKQ